MTDSELYKSLSVLTKNKSVWEEQIPYVESLLSADSVKIKSKALWMLGEMGLAFPSSIKNSVDAIASFLDSTEPLLRERAINALGKTFQNGFLQGSEQPQPVTAESILAEIINPPTKDYK